ncbi:MAG TPA: TM2 domain-containing protein [Saprospiraceae bacterium]|nr:TM2 domain-containing protein [Saprospiraceae bacterium]
MKTRLLLILSVLVLACSMSYASFPVDKTDKAEQVVNQENLTVYQASDLQMESKESISELSTMANDASEQDGESKGKSQLIALILVALLGGLGIHRFYLGYTWQGVVQLLTAGGCGVWAIIDLIRIVTGDLKPNGGEYTETL